MNKYTQQIDFKKYENEGKSLIEEIAKEGARKMLTSALEKEISEYLEEHQSLKNEKGHRQIVRNGYLPERDIITGIGPIKIKQPRVDDRGIPEKNPDRPA